MLLAAPASGASGTADVFVPNPVQSSGDDTLRDARDAADAVPAGEYVRVTLRSLDGSGYLRGTWANVRAETGKPAYSEAGRFVYDRGDDRFEQVMAYFWVTEAQRYLRSLGFTGSRAVNAESQDVRVDQYGVDNSFSWDKHDYIRLGKGGVDDGEDGEVIVHEYGHAVHDAQVPGFGASHEAGAIGEAFGDYLAVTVGLEVARQWGVAVRGLPTCVADWDATSYRDTPPICLRRVDEDLTYADLGGESVHRDGMIWSRALWDIRRALGSRTADTIIISAQERFAPDTTFSAAARATVAEAELLAGGRAADAVRDAFRARLIPGV